jgi:hypothetical protein
MTQIQVETAPYHAAPNEISSPPIPSEHSTVVSPRKRKRALSDNALDISVSHQSSQLTPLPSSSPTLNPPVHEGYPFREIPTIPLLYHLAITAHHAAQSHLQQAFIPPNVSCEFHSGYPPITIPTLDYQKPKAFEHDVNAARKVIGLQVLALDLLRRGLDSNELSDREKIAFGLEFGEVGIKVVACGRMKWGKGKEVESVGLEKLEGDMQDVIGEAVSFCVCLR